MSKMKELLLEELQLIDDNYQHCENYYEFAMGMLAMTRILTERIDYADENQRYLLSELRGVRDIWMENNQPM